MEPKSPQEKKRLSYAKDRRNTYGENDKASRKNISLRKASVNRIYRRKVNETLQQVDASCDLEIAESVEVATLEIQRKDWKKTPDTPLGETVERTLERRESHAGNGKAARKKVRELVGNLTIELDRETDGRWIAEAKELNGVVAYGDTEKAAIAECKRIAGFVYLEDLAAGKILDVNDRYISVERH